MKRFVSIILSLFLVISNSIVAFAHENVEFYVYTSNTEEFDKYASENIGNYIYGHYGYLDDTIELGKGVSVYGNVDNPIVVYPIWKNNVIVATFMVVLIDNEFTGTYSSNNVAQLNYVKELISLDRPLKLAIINDEFYFLIDNDVYDANSNIGIVIKDVIVSEIDFKDGQVIDCSENIEFILPIIPKVPTGYSLGWSYSYHNPEDDYYCHAYSLSGLLMNQGFTQYTFSKVKSGITTFEGGTIPLTKANVAKVVSYLKKEGFTCVSSSSGYLSYTDIQTYLYNNQKYVMVGLTYEGSGNHFGVITAYANLSGTITYTIYDPRSEGSGLCTMSGSTRKFTNSDLETYIWDAGYITGVTK